MMYHVSSPNSYLVITGAGIERVKIQKKALVLPFQKVTKISITPFDFSMSLQAMTAEKLNFSLPAVFTIGPRDSIADLEKYAVLLTGNSDGTIPSSKTVGTGRNHVQEIVKGIIEGETRSIVSTMTMEELFNNRTIFKTNVIKNVQSELNQFGLCVYNANVKELQDMPGSQYFEFLSKKAHEGAQNQARVDVAHARMLGEVGEAERQGETKQAIAKINAHTAVLETERKVEKLAADAKLKSREISIERTLKIERIDAARAAEEHDIKLQTNVEQKKAEMELERLRAIEVTRAKIEREAAQQAADAAAYGITAAADAERYAATTAAEVELVKSQRAADAALYAKQREAAGLMELAGAYERLGAAVGGPQGLMQLLMMQSGTYERMADANARAIQGLKPKISVWNTGSGDGDGVDSMAPIRNLAQCLPPMLQTIQEQTGISPPSWLAKMGPQEQEVVKGSVKMNGKVDVVNGES